VGNSLSLEFGSPGMAATTMMPFPPTCIGSSRVTVSARRL
jgi:hypothetical protein